MILKSYQITNNPPISFHYISFNSKKASLNVKIYTVDISQVVAPFLEIIVLEVVFGNCLKVN